MALQLYIIAIVDPFSLPHANYISIDVAFI